MEKQTLSEWITEAYGSPSALNNQLNHVIFMLHFLQEDTFSPREVQDAAELLKGLGEVLD
ncbi:hypothetical protein ACOKFD_10970 [Flagellimonas sp. S174]|uniref:hypothetical protein n=1 Tax=Flagellimonas sp. S174 TaxID=3410790 RepID=UPI003BF57164